jgi:hypothetical protein
MFKKIAIALVVAIGVFLAFASTRPATYHVERSISVAAPAPVLFGNVDNFKTWSAWSPWDKLDPQMQKTLSGPPSGVGAAYAWQGNSKVGKGSMTITAVEAPTKATYRLEFIEPFTSVATTLFTIAPQGDKAATITWAMDGNNNFVGKIMSVFMNMDKMIGGDFEKGLAALKIIAEDQAKRQAEAEAAAKAKADAEAAAKAAAEAEAAKVAAEAAAAAEAEAAAKTKGKKKK